MRYPLEKVFLYFKRFIERIIPCMCFMPAPLPRSMQLTGNDKEVLSCRQMWNLSARSFVQSWTIVITLTSPVVKIPFNESSVHCMLLVQCTFLLLPHLIEGTAAHSHGTNKFPPTKYINVDHIHIREEYSKKTTCKSMSTC